MSTTIEDTQAFFEAAYPAPGNKNIHTQMGVHFEEVAEMIAAFKGKDRLTQSMLTAAMVSVHALALHLKANGDVLGERNLVEVLDSLCDQIVTAVGVGHMMGMDVPGALAEVNASNFSKFGPDGKPIYDGDEKMMKGPDYREPNLLPFVR